MASLTQDFSHPYDMKTARWIREHFIFEYDDDKRKEFLVSLSDIFGSKSAEVLQYISKDYRVFIRDDQMWPNFKDDSWNGAVWSCGRALTCLKTRRSINSFNCLEHPKA